MHLVKCIKYTNGGTLFRAYCRLTMHLKRTIIIIRKGVVNMGKAKKKRRRKKPTTQPSRMESLTADILAGTISGLLVLAIQKLLNW